MVKQTEVLLKPNADLRVEQFISDKIQPGPVVRRMETDIFGQNLVEAGNDIGPGTSYGVHVTIFKKRFSKITFI